MNILVCVKQVPDDYVKVHLDENGKPEVAGIDKVVNAFDTYAVEMAVRYCEKHGGRVVVATIGEESQVRPALVQMIAVGAAQGYLAAPAAEEPDEAAMAAELSAMVKACEVEEGAAFDLILCGKESTDEISSQIGAMLAEKMGLGFVSSAVGFEPVENGLRVQQETEEGYAYYETACPAVLTVAKPEYDPRYPTLKSKMAARKAVIPNLASAAVAENPAVTCLGYSEPPKRTGGMKIQEKEAAEAVAKAMAVLIEDKVL